MIKKVINAKAKTSLQLPLEIRKIDSKCPKSYKLSKKTKNKANCDHGNKNKFIQNSSYANTS